MTGFDIIVLVITGIAAIGGFMRGIVQEVLSLFAWVLAIAAIRVLHKPLTDQLATQLGDTATTSIFAFVLLLLIPYAAMKVIANNAGKAARGSVLGFIDRTLGFAFGAMKGLIIVVIAFSVLVLGFDTIWGAKGRPNWIATARSYEFVDASSRSMVQMIGERRSRQRASQAADSE